VAGDGDGGFDAAVWVRLGVKEIRIEMPFDRAVCAIRRAVY